MFSEGRTMVAEEIGEHVGCLSSNTSGIMKCVSSRIRHHGTLVLTRRGHLVGLLSQHQS